MKIKLLVLSALLFHLLLLATSLFTDWPEMIAWPYFILKGFMPYKDLSIAHTPVLFTTLAFLYKFFGIGVFQLKIFTWILILISDLTLYLLVKKIFNERLAALSLIFYIPLQILYEGNGLWFDLALVPMAIVLFYLVQTKKYYFAGVIFALAFFTKQTAVWFLPPIFITLISQSKFIQNSFKFSFAAVVTSFVAITPLFLLGILKDFFNWAIYFGIFILPRSEGQIAIPSIYTITKVLFPFLPLLAIFIKNKQIKLISVWTFFLAFGTFPRWELFHFQPSLPFLSILIAILFTKYYKNKYFKIAFSVYIVLVFIFFGRFILKNYAKANRFNDANNTKIVNYLKSTVPANSSIYVLNYWDNIYALTNTLPGALPWTPHLKWYMDRAGVQDKMIKSFELRKPKYIIAKKYSDIGLDSYKPGKLDNYIKQNYSTFNEIKDVLILKRI